MHVFGLNESGGHSNGCVKVTFFVEHDNSLTFQLTPVYSIEWYRTLMLRSQNTIDPCRTFLQDVNAQQRKPL